MFRFFDKDYDNDVSFKEFRVACDEMDLRFSNEDIKILFGYLDKDGGGTIGYNEFLNLSDEKRLGLDPMVNISKNKVKDHVRDKLMKKYQINDVEQSTIQEETNSDIMSIFEQRNKLFDIERFKGKN